MLPIAKKAYKEARKNQSALEKMCKDSGKDCEKKLKQVKKIEKAYKSYKKNK